MFHRLRSDLRQLDVSALLEAQYLTQVTLALISVLHSPLGSRDSLGLWVQSAPSCPDLERPNANMLLHLEHLQWSST